DSEEYVLGTAIGLTTFQFAQVVGFAVGGTSVAFLGARTSLVIDAATFAASGLLIQGWVRTRPGPAADLPAADPRAPGRRAAGRPPLRLGSIQRAAVTGTRLVFASQVLRTTMLFGWLAAFYDAPEGVATPLARTLGGGALAVGAILAAQALGQTS